ncbi:MAG: S4 domain-containing protein, partial [Gemmatimonadaceae bacterium]
EREIPTFDLDGKESFDTRDILNAVTSENGALFTSRGEARRALEQGGVYINGERVGVERVAVPHERLLHGRYLLVRRGARNYALVRVRFSR